MTWPAALRPIPRPSNTPWACRARPFAPEACARTWRSETVRGDASKCDVAPTPGWSACAGAGPGGPVHPTTPSETVRGDASKCAVDPPPGWSACAGAGPGGPLHATRRSETVRGDASKCDVDPPPGWSACAGCRARRPVHATRRTASAQRPGGDVARSRHPRHQRNVPFEPLTRGIFALSAVPALCHTVACAGRGKPSSPPCPAPRAPRRQRPRGMRLRSGSRRPAVADEGLVTRSAGAEPAPRNWMAVDASSRRVFSVRAASSRALPRSSSRRSHPRTDPPPAGPRAPRFDSPAR
jgi:hypothetical protein